MMRSKHLSIVFILMIPFLGMANRGPTNLAKLPCGLSSSITIDVNYNGYDVSCASAADGAISVHPSGGTPPYTYDWYSGSQDSFLFNIPAGFYEVTVTDVTGCTTVSNVTLVGPEPLQVNPIVSEESSPGEGDAWATVEVISGGTPPFIFDWSDGSTGDTLSFVFNGEYDVTITDYAGCQEMIPISIGGGTTCNNPIILDALITPASAPGVNDGQAQVQVFGGTAPFTYNWSNGDISDLIIDLLAGNYDVTVSDSTGCTETLNIFVPVDSMACSLTASIQENQSIFCISDTSGILEVIPSNGSTPYTYQWDNGSTEAVLTNLSEGYYAVTVIDADGCLITLDYVFFASGEPLWIYPIGIAASSPGASDGMATVEVIGGTPPFTYDWANGASSDTITGLTAGLYEVTVTDVNGCSDFFPVEVGYNCGFTATISEQQSISCFDGNDGILSVSVSGGTGPFSYEWITGDTNTIITDLFYGFYDVIVTDGNGCSSFAEYFLLDPDPLIPITNTSNESSDGANDGTASVTVYGGFAPYTYNWSTGESTNSITGLAAGVYELTVTDSTSCSQIVDVFVGSNDAGCLGLEVFTIINSNFNGYDVSCFDASDAVINTSVSGGATPYTYQWDNESTGASLSNVGFGTYFLTVTDANGCTGVSDVTIIPPPSILAVATATAETSAGANDGTINTTVFGGVETYTYAWSNSATTANLSGLSPGAYTLTVTDANGCTYSLSSIVDAANADTDGDGVANSSDNCPTVSNADQRDSDNNGQGDACTCNPASASLPSSAGIHRSAYSSKIDGWTNYCSAAGKLLLSLALDNTGAVIPDNEVRLEIGSSTTSYYNDSIGFIDNGSGGVFINRNWDVRPTTQPTSNVPVRYYFLNSEFEELNTELANYNLAPIPIVTDMQFFKITDANLGIFPPLPTVPASSLELISHGTSRGVNTWVHSTHGSVDHIAEYEVYSFSGGGGGGAESGASLPVELVDFSGKMHEGEAHLNWTTASEIDNLGWDIQRKLGNNEWEDIAFVNGNLNSFTPNIYSYVDSKLSAGVYYYRLRQQDVDGSVDFSNVIALQFINRNQAQIYPNPAKDELVVYQAEGKARLFNSQGDLLQEFSIQEKTSTISVRELNSGIYFLEVMKDDGTLESFKFYKAEE